MNKKHIKVMVLCFVLVLIFPLLTLASESGEITALIGNVDITSPGENARPAKMGDKIFVGDIIRTKSKSKVEITFSDGDVMRLAQSSRIEVSEYSFGDSGRRGIFKLFRGKVQNIVKVMAGKKDGTGAVNSYITITFSDVELNTGFARNVFKIDVPPGYEVVEERLEPLPPLPGAGSAEGEP